MKWKTLAMIETTYIDHMGSDLSVVNAARVSFGKKSEDFSDKDAKLIQYLAKHKHLSPFGHAFASFHVKAPVFVRAQLVKHKFLRVNEISRRYVDSEPDIFVPEIWRGRSEDKKQGSSGEVPIAYIDAFSKRHIKDYWEETYAHSIGEKFEDGDYRPEASILDEIKAHYEYEVLPLYNMLLSVGVAPEQARMVLPQSMMTEWYWSGSLDAFAAMCKLRCASDTQFESQQVANQISAEMEKLFPVSWKALMEA